MKVIRDPSALPDRFRGATVALGNFDGVHAGHRAVIDVARAAVADAPVGVVTFEPHPRQLFRPGDPPFRLTEEPAKLRRLSDTGLAFVLLLTFDRAFSETPAEAFVDDLLVRALGARHVTAGRDFRFGHRRRGDDVLLTERLSAAGVSLRLLDGVTDARGEVCSSSRVRAFLQAGAPREAATLLGAPWEIEGVVSEGDKRGRVLGFPTANIPLGAHLRPKAGVYATRTLIDDHWLPGVANLGARPTVDGTDTRLEVHLFDFTGDLYGRTLRTQLIEFLRDERKFPGLDALKDQIARDSQSARRVLAA